MNRRTSFLIYIAIFIVTWPSNFAVKGIPKNRNEQCRELGYDAACMVREDRHVCQMLTCGRHRDSSRISRRGYFKYPLILRNGVPDYTECGQSKICMNRKCVQAIGPMPQYQSSISQVKCKKKQPRLDEPVMTRHEQCQQYGFDVACYEPEGFTITSCNALKCGYEEADGIYVTRAQKNIPMQLRPMAGSRCGHNAACLNTMCVPLHQWPSAKERPIYTGPEQTEICCPETEN